MSFTLNNKNKWEFNKTKKKKGERSNLNTFTKLLSFFIFSFYFKFMEEKKVNAFLE